MPTFLLPAEPIVSLDAYLATETGGLGVARAQHIGPAATIDEVLRSGLRGRGGGGFPTGRKWAGAADQTSGRRYLVGNGAEGEPGTFKDRALLRANPYQLVEGLVIAAFAIGADEVFVCLKATFDREIEAVTRAVQEFQRAGICTDCKVSVVGGPDEYLFGEEKAMLEVIEGKPPLPRLFPPYVHGLFTTGPQEGWEATARSPGAPAASNPTVVNNVETLSNVPHILARGADEAVTGHYPPLAREAVEAADAVFEEASVGAHVPLACGARRTRHGIGPADHGHDQRTSRPAR